MGVCTRWEEGAGSRERGAWNGEPGAGSREQGKRDPLTAPRSLSSGLQPPGNGNEPPIHRIGSEAELFERDHAKDRLGARFAEYDDRRLDAVAHADVDPRHRIEDLTPVGQNERPLVLRHDTKAFQD